MSALRPHTKRMTGLLATATAVTTGLIAAGPAQALVGPEAPAGQHAYTAKLTIGDDANSRACTAAVVDQWWVATAASCFAGTAGEQVPAGKPALKSTATLSNGQSSAIVELVPRADRDLVLARLAVPATGIAPVKRATTVPAAGTDLTAAGFGRTKTDWVPGKAHTGTFTTNTTDATTLAITGKGTDVLCKGDTGGPLLNAAGELVGINSRSWQGGCFGNDAAETRTGAVSVRTDDLGAWIAATADPLLIRPGQTIASGTTIVGQHLKLSMQADGNMVIYHKSGGDGKGAAIWSTNTYGNPGAYAIMQEDGNFVVYKKDGGEGKGGSLWSSNTYGNGTENRGSFLTFQNDGNLVVYKKDGGEGKGGNIWASGTWARPNKMTGGWQYPAPFWVDAGSKILMADRGGRLIIWDKTKAKEVWTSNAYTGEGGHLDMQNDGNLVLYKKDGGDGKGGFVWSSNTFAAGAYAHFQNDGNFVIYKKDGGEGKGGAIWHTNTWQ
ncbi:trypsin-like serine protease [Streptomyces sp. NPDC048340]|uniref:trypsin-like serine protease n=1 Tax=Streptomyces sp. NPDC048340 TaxID=3365537 RepID=UPI00371547CE